MADGVRYTYFACTTCHYDCVLAIQPLERGKVFCCPICFDLTGELFDLAARPSTEHDVPSGLDQRTGAPR